MSYTPEIQNKISTLNSTVITPISGGTVFQGTGEDVSKYGRAGVSIWTPFGEPTDGILTIEVSRDGINWGGPNRTFSATNVAQPHMWNIVEKYFRIKYTHGTTSASTLVIQTQFSVNADILLGHQLDETLLNETEAIITRSVNVGQNPTNNYVNQPIDGIAFQSTDNIASGGTFSTDVLDIGGYTQVQTHISADQSGVLGFKFCSTANCSGTTVGENGVERYLSVPYDPNEGYQLYSAPAFAPYVQYTFENTGTGSTTHFYYDSKFLTKSLSGQLLAMNSFISSSMVANLGRNVLVGQDISNNFENVSVTPTTNTSGTTYNLNVVSGARPSELPGRTRISEVITGETTNKLQRTITTNKKFEVTDLILTIENSDTANSGRLNIIDGLSTTGTTILPILIAEATSNETSVSVITHTFSEPIEINVGIFLEIASGTLNITGTIIGYEE